MSEPIPFWQRVSRVFRPAAPPGGDGSSSAEAPVALTATRTEPHRSELVPADRAPWWRPQARRAQTREAAQRVAELASALQDHFRQQDDRAAALASALDRVGGVLAQLAANQREQGECVKTIAAHADSAARSAASVVGTLAKVPESLNAQADAIRSVARQLEIGQESDNQLMHSLQQFGRAVDTLGTSGTAQVEALQRLTTAQQRQQDAFAALVTEQSRRYLVVVLITGVLSLAAIAVAIVSLLLRGR